MPTLDYKWWARSYRKQVLIRDMAREKIEMHIAGLIVIDEASLADLRMMADQLTKQIERRKNTNAVVQCSSDIRVPIVVCSREGCGAIIATQTSWSEGDGYICDPCHFVALRAEG